MCDFGIVSHCATLLMTKRLESIYYVCILLYYSMQVSWALFLPVFSFLSFLFFPSTFSSLLVSLLILRKKYGLGEGESVFLGVWCWVPGSNGWFITKDIGEHRFDLMNLRVCMWIKFVKSGRGSGWGCRWGWNLNMIEMHHLKFLKILSKKKSMYSDRLMLV